MSRIDSWLADLGLEKYIPVFAEAEIDFETLPVLLEEDLKELNLPIGPRRKIWAAISQLDQQDAPPTPHPAPTTNQDSREAPAERRHLTVMFVDLVGSTEMVGRLGAEDMRELIIDFQSAIGKVVTRFDGFIAQFLGDGVLCYFGWPHANEDDPERAVRAGLSIIETVRNRTAPDGTKLAVRIGIATGVVVIGDLFGSSAAQETSAVGKTPNLAARLQGIAGPNQLVVSSDLLPLLGASFEVTSLGAHDLKGVGHAIEAFVVKGEKAVESRFAARSSVSMTPIVGRDREIDRIIECWSQARTGKGQAVLLRGEAGIGKSRVVRAVADAVATDDHARVTFQCSPYHTESAFYPFIQQLSYSAGFAAEDTTEQRLEKLEAIVSGDDQTRALIAHLLGIDGAARYGEIEATPEQQRTMLMQGLIDMLMARARANPLMLIFEDLHWIDPTSLEVMGLFLDAAEHRKVMILATARPSPDNDYAHIPAITQIELSRLDRETTQAVIMKMTGGRALPNEILEIIIQRTDGVPLFVEELTKSILESDALRQAEEAFLVNGSLSDIAIPATLHDSLMARLDRLGSTREIAQIAACVGRDFSHGLMAQICDLPGPELEASLEKLIEAELIYRRGAAPTAHYFFKHALVRDAAYDGLLKERRAQFHLRILTALETQTVSPPELLATHAEAALLTDRAIELWQAAGKAATSRPAYKEAEAHLRRAIGLNAPRVEAGKPGALEKALELKVQLFVALSPGKGLWADETVDTLEEALALSDQVGDTPLRGDILCGLLLSTYFRGNLERSVTQADELTELARGSGDMAQLLFARRLAAASRLKMGRFSEAQRHMDDAEALCDLVADQNLAARFGHDPVVGVKIYQCMSATFQGRTALANRKRLEAEDRARKIAHANTSCAMLGLALNCTHIAGDVAEERRILTELLQLIEEHAVLASNLWAVATYALLKIADGEVDAIAEYRAAEQTMLDANIRLLLPGNRVVAARRAMMLDRMDDATELAEAAVTLMNDTGEKSWLPEYHRLRAAFALRDNDAELAEQRLLAAIEIAHRDGGVLWELRAVNDLAPIYRQTGREGEANRLLDRVHAKIAPGDCPLDMPATTHRTPKLRVV